jgi:hypothetical protein
MRLIVVLHYIFTEISLFNDNGRKQIAGVAETCGRASGVETKVESVSIASG